MQNVLNVKTKTDYAATTNPPPPELVESRYCEPPRIRQVGISARGNVQLVSDLQEEDITKLVECMALNSASTSEEEESEASEVLEEEEEAVEEPFGVTEVTRHLDSWPWAVNR